MISLSLCMIVKNEEAVLERILKPVSQVMDAILIADTGSSDRTKEIAEQYTSQVFDFPWCDDFSAPRNFLLEKVRTDYWMWMDADDVLNEENLEKLKSLKEALDPGTDVVMMEYAAGFDQSGRTTFSYFRERIMKTSRNFRWNGAVHETVIPEGNIIYSDVVIRHRKCGKGDPDRNLRIYEKMLAGGEKLEPRHQLYYGRELYYHQRYPEAEAVLVEFLKNPSGWLENKIDACFVLGQCYRKMGEKKSALEAFLYSLTMDVPRAEICCEVGKIFLERELPRQAAYWYGQALTVPSDKKKGGFFMAEYHGFSRTVSRLRRRMMTSTVSEQNTPKCLGRSLNAETTGLSRPSFSPLPLKQRTLDRRGRVLPALKRTPSTILR